MNNPSAKTNQSPLNHIQTSFRQAQKKNRLKGSYKDRSSGIVFEKTSLEISFKLVA